MLSDDGRPLDGVGARRGDIELLDPSAHTAKGRPAHSSASHLLAEWARPPFLSEPPPSATKGASLLKTVSIQFYIGAAGSGAQPHWHAPAWNWLARGEKRWHLWPPIDATYAQNHVANSLPGASREGGAPLQCTQRAGDIIIVPELWGHATTNLKPSIGWATEMSFDRNFDLGIEPKPSFKDPTSPSAQPSYSPARYGSGIQIVDSSSRAVDPGADRTDV